MKTQLYEEYSRRMSWGSWATFILARKDYKEKRINGDEKVDAHEPWMDREPDEKSITWTKGEKKSDGWVYGVKESDGYYHYECRYDADSSDLEWMRKTDCNYLKRILKAGDLQKLEPDVWRLREIDHAQNMDIGEWWSEKLKIKNIGDLLANSTTEYQKLRESKPLKEQDRTALGQQQLKDQEEKAKQEQERLKREQEEKERARIAQEKIRQEAKKANFEQPSSQLQTNSANSVSSSSSSSSVTSGASFFASEASNSVSAASSSSVALLQVQATTADKKEAKISSGIASLKETALKGDVDAQARLGIAYFNGDEGVVKDVLEATKWFKLAAQQINTPAGQYAQGRCYAEGLAVAKDEKKSVELYRLAAEQKYALAQYALGFCYEKGIGVAKDEKEAVKLYRLAAEQGLAKAQFNLGVCYHYGKGVAKNEKKAVEFYRLAAEQCLANAQHALGTCYENGTGVAKDEKEAVRFYRLAADQGLAKAKYNLGACYANSTGVAKDEKEAVRLCRLAAEQGYANAQFTLGSFYADGTGVAKDEKEAVRLYRLAADQRYADAQYNLGVCYENGRGVEKDEKEAVRLYRLAAEQGYADAQYNLGVCYKKGTGVVKDEKEAVRLYRLAAEQGLAAAQYNLGFCYADGAGIAKDEKEAVKFFLLATEQKFAKAQGVLGACYEYGRGVEKDEKEAVRLYRLAADQGLATAQCQLGVHYENGIGVAKDEKEAVKLYRLAADQGYATAQFNLGVCYENGTSVAKDEKEAVRLYRLATEQKFANAQYNLGVCYECGRGVEKDEKEAIRFYRLAAEQGFAIAQYILAVRYHFGIGVSKNLNEAIRLYTLAAAQGNQEAKTALKSTQTEMQDLEGRLKTTIDQKAKVDLPTVVTDKSSVSEGVLPLVQSEQVLQEGEIKEKVEKAALAEIHRQVSAGVSQELSQTHVVMLQELQRFLPQLQAVSQIDQKTMRELQGEALAFTGSISKEKLAQLATQEKKYILNNDRLGDYYYSFIAQFSSTYIACKSIHSGKVKDEEKTKADYVGQGIDALGKHIPGVSVLTAIFSGAIATFSERDKKLAANKIATFFTHMQEADIFIEELARRLVFVVETEINQLVTQKVGIFKRVVQGAEAIKNWFTANDVDTVIKKLAGEHFKNILQAIIDGKLKAHPTSADLAAIIKIAVPTYQPQQPVSASSTTTKSTLTQSVVAVAVRVSMPTIPSSSSSSLSVSSPSISTTQDVSNVSTAELLKLFQEERAARLAMQAQVERLKKEVAKKADGDHESSIGGSSQQLYAASSSKANSIGAEVSVDDLHERVQQLEFWQKAAGPVVAQLGITSSDNAGDPDARTKLLQGYVEDNLQPKKS